MSGDGKISSTEDWYLVGLHKVEGEWKVEDVRDDVPIYEPNVYESEGSSALMRTANRAGKVAAEKVVRIVASKSTGSLGLPVIIGIVAAFLLVVAGMGIKAFIFLSSAGGKEETQPGEGYYGGDISVFGANEIPSQYIPIYKAAQEKYGVPWNLLGAEHRVEIRFSTLQTMVSPVEAIGPFQFMPLTWLGWGYPRGYHLGNAKSQTIF